jgi:tetratricopeptide (TPR) repeat protein
LDVGGIVRQEWFAALAAHVNRLEGNFDPDVALDPRMLALARQIQQALGDEDEDLPGWRVLGFFYTQQRIAQAIRGEQSLPGEDRDALLDALGRCFAAGLDVPEGMAFTAAVGAASRAADMLSAAEQSPDVAPLTAVAHLWQRIIATVPVDFSGRPSYLRSLSATLLERFWRTRDASDLDAAVTIGRQAVETASDDDARSPGILLHAGRLLGIRFEEAGDPADLDAAVSVLRRSLDLLPVDSPDRAWHLAMLGSSLMLRFQHSGEPADLDAAIVVGQQAIQTAAPDDENLPQMLLDRGQMLVLRFEQTGITNDLDEGIAAFRLALDARGNDDHDMAKGLSGLGNALRIRFTQTGDPSDLDEAVSMGRQAVERTTDDDLMLGVCLLNLGAALQARAGTEADATEAVAVLERAVATLPAESPLRPLSLSNLSLVLRDRSERTGALSDLDAAIGFVREAVEATPPGSPGQLIFLRNLCLALSDRYDRTAAAADLAEALSVGRRMAGAIPDGYPDQAVALSAFGAVLTGGYEGTKDAALLDEAIAVHRRAVASLRYGDPREPEICSNLASALERRFTRTSERQDIDEAVAILERAVGAAGDTADGGWPLVSLGRALLARMGQAVDPDEIDRTVRVLREAVGLLPGHERAEGQVLLARALRKRFEWSGHRPDLDEAAALSRAAVDATPVGHPNLGAYRATLGNVLALQAPEREETPPEGEAAAPPANDERAELITAVAIHVERIAPPDLTVTLDPAALADVRRLTTLLDAEATPDLDAWELIRFFQSARFLALPAETEDDGDEDEALDAELHAYVPLFVAGREIPQDMLAAVAERAATEVGVGLFDENLAARNSQRANQVINLWRRIVQAMPGDDDVERPLFETVLGRALSLRYCMSGEPEDLEEGITMLRRGVATIPPEDPAWAISRVSLGAALLQRFQASGSSADLEEALSMTEAAVTESAVGEEWATLRAQHALALLGRSQSTGDDWDLETAVALLSQATREMSVDDPDRATALANLAEALRIRFERAGDEIDLQRSVSAATEAAAVLPDGHPSRGIAVLSLGVALMTKAAHTGSESDLDAAIGHFNSIIAASVPGQPEHKMSRANLAGGLFLKFLYGGRRADLNAAIDAARRVMDEAATGFFGYAIASLNLSAALLARFAWVGDEQDLDDAVDAARGVLEAVQPGSREAGQSLVNMTVALRRRMERVGTRDQLSEAMTLAQRVMDTVPADSRDRGLYQASIAASLRRLLYRFTDDPADLDEAIGLARQAVELCPDDHFLTDKCLAEFAAGLKLRLERGGNETDFSEAEAALNRAIDGTGGSDRAEYRIAMGDLYRARFLRRPTREDHLWAIGYYLATAEDQAAQPWIRITAARMGAMLVSRSVPERAADLLETAVLQLPLVASRQLARSDQQRALSEFAFLAGDAAALRLEAGGQDAPPRALGLLELGRAILHGQALDMRQDLIALHVAHPALAQEFVRLRDLLEAPTDAAVTAMLLGVSRTGPDRHAATEEFATLLGRIRALDEFGSFLLPPSPGELTAQAARGPVAVFNISLYRSDALVVTKDAITQVPLPDITFEALMGKVGSFDDALTITRNPAVSHADRIRAEDALSEILEWVWDVAAKPVLDHLGHVRAHEEKSPWPRVWWVPGGLLGMLPLHAAGYHRSGTGETVLDRVISSYTPTVRALTYARSRGSWQPPRRALIVAMPTTPGQSDLPGAMTEAAKLGRRLPSPTLLVERSGVVDESTPTRDAVKKSLAEAAIAHFACHAASHPTDPSRSQILLHDYREHPFTVASLTSVRLHQAQLAYLSACETARNQVTELADEAIHLTSAFLLAGYPHVIGTLWSINDAIAVDLAESFYIGLEKTRQFDVSRSATALHHAIRSVRDRLDYSHAPSSWAAFTHTGA